MLLQSLRQGFELLQLRGAMDFKKGVIEKRSSRGARIDAVLWGLFFVWIGIVLLFQVVPPGVGSLGVGVIVLGGAMARLIAGVSVSNFWLIIGALFVIAGAGELLKIDLPLLPAALIVCGVLLLFHRRSGRRTRP